MIMVAWNGERCDLKWLWKITQAPGSRCCVPEKLQYHIDPYHVITKYTSCKINPIKSKIEALELGVVYKFLNGNPLEGAHDSLVDCKAQSTIIMDESFVPFINRTQSVKLITQLFDKTTINEWKKRMEPVQPVHEPWIELTEDNDVTWEPQFEDKYTGPNGGTKAGPTQYIVNIARNSTSLADIFFGILPAPFFDEV